MSETRGERIDRQRELRALDEISAALRLPLLRELKASLGSHVNESQIEREARLARIEKIDHAISQAERQITR